MVIGYVKHDLSRMIKTGMNFIQCVTDLGMNVQLVVFVQCKQEIRASVRNQYRSVLY